MAIQAYVSVVLREHCGGKSTFELESNTLGGAIRTIDDEYPGFHDQVFDLDGSIRKEIRVSINGELIPSNGGKDHPLIPDDQLFLLYAIAGG